MQFPFEPPVPPDMPPPGPVYTFLFFVVLILGAVEVVVAILPKEWQRQINRVRFGARWNR